MQAIRQPICADGVYPSHPTALKRMLNGYLAGVTHNPPVCANAAGIISPHIDYARGGAVYAHAWQAIAPLAQAADLVIILGTDHRSAQTFTLTQQHYATPYGVLPTATAIVNGLIDALGPHALRGEHRHNNEHSLELPLVWLHHMRQGQACEVVPILVGALGRYDHTLSPASQPNIATFITVLRTLTYGRRVMVVASGDLSHVGPVFDGAALDGPAKTALQADDHALIHHIQHGNAEAFYADIAQQHNKNNVCGSSPFYLAMTFLAAQHAQLHDYALCPADRHNTSVVSICSMTLGK